MVIDPVPLYTDTHITYFPVICVRMCVCDASAR